MLPLHYALMAWCSVKAQRQFYLYLFLFCCKVSYHNTTSRHNQENRDLNASMCTAGWFPCIWNQFSSSSEFVLFFTSFSGHSGFGMDVRNSYPTDWRHGTVEGVHSRRCFPNRKTFVRLSEGEWAFERPRCRWDYTIRMRLGEGVDWIYLAHDRDLWRALIHTVMKVWVP
jgi:hypothetical protein